MAEICAACGKLIATNEPAYQVANSWGKDRPSRHYHSGCGDPFSIRVYVQRAVDAERERCAQIAEAIVANQQGNEMPTPDEWREMGLKQEIERLREALKICVSYLESETGMTMKHPILKSAKDALSN